MPNHNIIVIGASMGGIEALSNLVSQLLGCPECGGPLWEIRNGSSGSEGSC